jgi:hypothetical protein
MPAVAHAPRSHYVGFYTVGLFGLGLAEACQVVAILVLISRWLSGTSTEKEPKELVVLLVSLIPYVVMLVFLITLVVYLRARRHDLSSPRRQQAARNLKDRAIDIVIGEGSDVAQAAASAPAATTTMTVGAPAAARPTLGDAVRRVIGPSTQQSLSDSAQGLLAITAVALLLSTVATLGVVVPAGGLAPLHSGGSGSAPASSGPGTPYISTGTWTVDIAFGTGRCTATSDPYLCKFVPVEGTASPFLASNDVQVTIQQSGTSLVMTFAGPPPAGDLFPYRVSGTVAGDKVAFSGTASQPYTTVIPPGYLLLSVDFKGVLTGSVGMDGTYDFELWTSDTPSSAQRTRQVAYESGSWTANLYLP